MPLKEKLGWWICITKDNVLPSGLVFQKVVLSGRGYDFFKTHRMFNSGDNTLFSKNWGCHKKDSPTATQKNDGGNKVWLHTWTWEKEWRETAERAARKEVTQTKKWPDILVWPFCYILVSGVDQHLFVLHAHCISTRQWSFYPVRAHAMVGMFGHFNRRTVEVWANAQEQNWRKNNCYSKIYYLHKTLLGHLRYSKDSILWINCQATKNAYFVGVFCCSFSTTICKIFCLDCKSLQLTVSILSFVPFFA